MLLAGAACSGQPRASESDTSNGTEPRLVKDAAGTEALELSLEKIPGLSVVPVQRVELPATLETTGQVMLDDRRAATIISRVTGRVEGASLSQWDNVRRGQPIVTLYSPLKVFFPVSAASLLLGLAYGVWNVIAHGKIPMGSALLIQLAVVVFLFGLISEQIASGQDRA